MVTFWCAELLLALHVSPRSHKELKTVKQIFNRLYVLFSIKDELNWKVQTSIILTAFMYISKAEAVPLLPKAPQSTREKNRLHTCNYGSLSSHLYIHTDGPRACPEPQFGNFPQNAALHCPCCKGMKCTITAPLEKRHQWNVENGPGQMPFLMMAVEVQMYIRNKPELCKSD